MNDPGWILVIEQGETWTAGLRTCLRRLPRRQGVPRVRRISSLPQFRNDSSSPLFVCVELLPNRLIESLQFLATLRSRPAVSAAALAPRNAPSELVLAANEAGASVVAESPGDCCRVVKAALRTLRLTDQRQLERLPAPDRVWRRLPWQTEPWSLG